MLQTSVGRLSPFSIMLPRLSDSTRFSTAAATRAVTSVWPFLASPESRAAYRNAQQQRRQAAQEQRVAAAGRAIGFFNEIAPMRGKLRAEMTQKYGVEF